MVTQVMPMPRPGPGEFIVALGSRMQREQQVRLYE